MFDRESHKYISVHKFGADWISKPDSYSVDKYYFEKIQSVSRISAFFKIWIKSVLTGNIYTNCIRPRDSAPFKTNIFVFLLRGKMDTEQKDLIKARKCSNIVRFIDNLTTINEGGKFMKFSILS